MRSINPWLTDRQLEDLGSQILRQPNRTLLEANEAIQKLLFKAQVDLNEETGESDPVMKLTDFEHPENLFHAINQFRIDTPGCVKNFIIPDIVLFVNGMARRMTSALETAHRFARLSKTPKVPMSSDTLVLTKVIA